MTFWQQLSLDSDGDSGFFEAEIGKFYNFAHEVDAANFSWFVSSAKALIE